MTPTSAQMIRQIARTTLSQSRRRTVHLDRRTLSTRPMSATAPLNAQPSQYVTGMTLDQLNSDPAIREWYQSNFSTWEEEPEKYIVPDADDAAAVEQVDETAEEKNPHAITLPAELTARNIRPLVAYLRNPKREEGSRNCEILRNDPLLPLVPGILHGSDPTSGILSHEPSSKIMVKTPWFEMQRELDRYHYGFTSRVYALTVFGETEAHVGYHKSQQNIKDNKTYHLDEQTMKVTVTENPTPLDIEIANLPPKRTPILENVLVIPADLQLHPVAHAAYCLNFVRYHPSKPIAIPIVSINEEESPAMKRGGFIAFVNRTIDCLVVEDGVIPESIQLECAGLRQKDVVRRDRLILPEGVIVHPRVKDDFLVGTVFGAKGKGADDNDAVEEKK